MADRKVRDDDDDDDDGISGASQAATHMAQAGLELFRRVNLCVATFLDPPTSSTSAAGVVLIHILILVLVVAEK